jgi:hypothetical protein
LSGLVLNFALEFDNALCLVFANVIDAFGVMGYVIVECRKSVIDAIKETG